jgi:hypothetical protein
VRTHSCIWAQDLRWLAEVREQPHFRKSWSSN